MRLPQEQVDVFLFTVAIRRVWAAVNSPYWIIHDSVSIANDRNLEGFQAGRDRYAPGSDALVESQELRAGFQRLIGELGIEALVTAASLADILRDMNAEGQWTF